MDAECPPRVNRHCFFVTSHTLAVPSFEAETMRTQLGFLGQKGQYSSFRLNSVMGALGGGCDFASHKHRVIERFCTIVEIFRLKVSAIIYLPVNGLPIKTSNVIFVPAKCCFELTGLVVPQTNHPVHAPRC